MAYTFEVVEHIALLKEYESGDRKELNRVTWNGGDAKLEIRMWMNDRKKPGKGITLSELESKVLRDALIGMELPD